ncbi:CU044_5270 family protein [Streptomyces sp. NPDC050418]|uniref:CU044_5270 family protein n=1 Tax=Streptomyces sp. NPDC050418 TaxID=3365612 RepID=UPI00379C7CF9
MNDFPSLPERDPSGRALPERELPEGRRDLLREHLLNEIRNESRQDTAGPRRAWLRPAFAGPAVAAAVALVVVGGFALAGGGEQGGQGGGERGGEGGAPPAAAPGAPRNAAQLLDRVATVAGREEATAVRDDQYVYVRTKAAWTVQEACEAAVLEKPSRREVWFAVDGRRPGVLRAEREGPQTIHLDTPTPGVPSNTYYRHLETLPTDPSKMLDWLHKASQGGKSEDQNTFVLVGDLVRESLIPPKVAAALYRAAAQIDGVTLVKDATDAIGRKGIAVGRVDEQSGLRQELLFDPKTYAYLGERGVTTRATDGGTEQLPGQPEKKCPGMPAGQITANTAVIERSVVDSAPKAAEPVRKS